MQSDIYETIEDKIKWFDDLIDEHYVSTNDEAVWLFLATLGCWSVNHAPSQFFTLAITLFLFLYRVIVKWKRMEKRTFPEINKDIKIIIESRIKEDTTRKKWLEELSKMYNKKTSILYSFKHLAIFILCYLFTVWTFIYALACGSR